MAKMLASFRYIFFGARQRIRYILAAHGHLVLHFLREFGFDIAGFANAATARQQSRTNEQLRCSIHERFPCLNLRCFFKPPVRGPNRAGRGASLLVCLWQ
jgi:hypothetical protein